MGSHATWVGACSARDWPLTVVLAAGCWPSSIRGDSSVVEVVEVIEHQIHVFLLLPLQVVNDPLVFMNLNSDMGVCLSGNRPGFDEIGRIVLIHVVTPLGRGHLRHHDWGSASCCIQLLLSPSNRLVVEVSALLLKLIIAHTKCISAKAIVAHAHIILVEADCILIFIIIFFDFLVELVVERVVELDVVASEEGSTHRLLI